MLLFLLNDILFLKLQSLAKEWNFYKQFFLSYYLYTCKHRLTEKKSGMKIIFQTFLEINRKRKLKFWEFICWVNRFVIQRERERERSNKYCLRKFFNFFVSAQFKLENWNLANGYSLVRQTCNQSTWNNDMTEEWAFNEHFFFFFLVLVNIEIETPKYSLFWKY